MSEATRGSERGLALVSVLWALSILSLIAASMISSGNVATLIERNALRRAQGNATADAAITLGIVGLVDPRAEKRWRIDGVPQKVSFGSTEIQVSIQDEYGLIDFNEADVSVLQGLFRSAGVAPDVAERLAARVIDWRTAGDLHGLGGANRADYRAAGLPYAPRGAAFQSVDELKLVLGITPEIFAEIAPALTVHAHQFTVDNRTAPKEALLALPVMSANDVNQILATRLSAPISDAVISLNGRAFTVRADFIYRRSRARRDAILRFTGDQERPFLVLASQ